MFHGRLIITFLFTAGEPTDAIVDRTLAHVERLHMAIASTVSDGFSRERQRKRKRRVDDGCMRGGEEIHGLRVIYETLLRRPCGLRQA